MELHGKDAALKSRFDGVLKEATASLAKALRAGDKRAGRDELLNAERDARYLKSLVEKASSEELKRAFSEAHSGFAKNVESVRLDLGALPKLEITDLTKEPRRVSLKERFSAAFQPKLRFPLKPTYAFGKKLFFYKPCFFVKHENEARAGFQEAFVRKGGAVVVGRKAHPRLFRKIAFEGLIPVEHSAEEAVRVETPLSRLAKRFSIKPKRRLALSRG